MCKVYKCHKEHQRLYRKNIGSGQIIYDFVGLYCVRRYRVKDKIDAENMNEKSIVSYVLYLVLLSVFMEGNNLYIVCSTVPLKFWYICLVLKILFQKRFIEDDDWIIQASV